LPGEVCITVGGLVREAQIGDAIELWRPLARSAQIGGAIEFW
jgi:hypothetical protein